MSFPDIFCSHLILYFLWRGLRAGNLKKYIGNINKIKMRQLILHKLVFNKGLWIFNETFETNETLFHGY